MRNYTCTNTNELWQGCTRPVAEGSPVSLCQLHLLVAAEFAGTIEIPSSTQLRERSPRKATGGRGGARFRNFEPSVVYYVRKGDRIKIGTSTNLPTRIKALGADELLACEPGALKVERRRHEQFEGCALGGEWFTPTPELLAHIRRVVHEHGGPRLVWNRVVSDMTRPLAT